MPRTKMHSREQVVSKALLLFWTRGYADTSIDELVETTQVSRHGLYTEFGGKHELFLACLDAYVVDVVTPAFEQVEAEGAGIDAIAQYFEHQIAASEKHGLPGPGCLMANTLTETAPHDEKVRRKVENHNTRLYLGFVGVLTSANRAPAQRRHKAEIEAIAGLLLSLAIGLWSRSRILSDADPLRRSVKTLIRLLKATGAESRAFTSRNRSFVFGKKHGQNQAS